MRVGTNGVTAAIGPTGQVIAALPIQRDGAISAAVPLHSFHTLYVRMGGDLPWYAFTLVCCVGAAIGLVRSRYRARA